MITVDELREAIEKGFIKENFLFLCFVDIKRVIIK